jgi:sugar phosphate isomerase/epimerase
MYDRGHPINSLDVYGKYLKIVQAKDGVYPTDPRRLGKEVPLGQGRVDFPSFIKKLKSINYEGSVIIEREASSGAQWDKEVIKSKDFLEVLLDS